MRYPLLAFIFVFVIPPFTAHALVSGRASIAPPAKSTFRLVTAPPATPAIFSLTRL